ncbi:hypothetical protein HOY80DRAFT_989261 [Tuber brumale]|nr:hypothetical protein HOY80DRAFT_989261 [Tuber brumale]
MPLPSILLHLKPCGLLRLLFLVSLYSNFPMLLGTTQHSMEYNSCCIVSSRIPDDTRFIPRVPDIYFKNLHHIPGAPIERDKASPRKLYNLIIATTESSR